MQNILLNVAMIILNNKFTKIHSSVIKFIIV